MHTIPLIWALVVLIFMSWHNGEAWVNIPSPPDIIKRLKNNDALQRHAPHTPLFCKANIVGVYEPLFISFFTQACAMPTKTTLSTLGKGESGVIGIKAKPLASLSEFGLEPWSLQARGQAEPFLERLLNACKKHVFCQGLKRVSNFTHSLGLMKNLGNKVGGAPRPSYHLLQERHFVNISFFHKTSKGKMCAKNIIDVYTCIPPSQQPSVTKYVACTNSSLGFRPRVDPLCINQHPVLPFDIPTPYSNHIDNFSPTNSPIFLRHCWGRFMQDFFPHVFALENDFGR